MSALVCVLTLVGLSMAVAALRPLHDISALVPDRRLKRAWSILQVIIIACLAMQATATVAKCWIGVTWADVVAAFVHLLGPGVVLALAMLARSSARNLSRLAEIERVAFLDPLTGLPNRRHFDHQLALELANASANGTSGIALALLDVDFFKRVNDTLGHVSGDAVLSQLAAIIAEAVGSAGLACRVGGEEFGLIFYGLDPRRLQSRTEAIRRAIEGRKFTLSHGRTIWLTVSIGLATAVDSDTATTLMERADAALYRAKQAGRNRIDLAA